jgi:hypothetical protein
MFEQVHVVMPDGQRHGPVDWNTVRQWTAERRIPPEAMLVDVASGQQRSVASFQDLPRGSGDEAVSTIIPYRNKPALIGYYLGVFSLLACIPLLGMVGVGMGIAAVVLGIKGLGNVKQNPQAKGTAHAWIAIVCGALFGLVGLAVQVLFIIGLVASQS